MKINRFPGLQSPGIPLYNRDMDTVNIPEVGSVVRVTTRHQNHYYYTYKEQPYVDVTYEGTVLPNERWIKPGSFYMTGNEQFVRTRVIAMKNVVRMEIVKGKTVKSNVRAFRVKSSNKKSEYLVTVVGKKVECNCPGFTYRHKCKHSAAVREKVAA